MSGNYLEFKKYIENKNPDIVLSNFSVEIDVRSKNATYIGNKPKTWLFDLDKEDLEYLKKKYYPKIDDEYHNELEKLKQKYNK